MFSKRNILFLIFTFTLTWGCWWSLALLVQKNILSFHSLFGQVLFMIGGSAPTIAAYFALLKTNGDLKKFHAQVLKIKVHYKWHLFAFFTPFILSAVGTGIAYLFDNQFLFEHPMQPLYMILPAFLISIILGGVEEFGWRGIVQPELSKKHGYFMINLILGTIWALWHLPLFYIQGVGHYRESFIIYALGAIAFSSFLTWLYAKTKSIFLCVVFHASINASATLGLGFVKDIVPAYIIHTVFMLMIGTLLLILLDKGFQAKNQK